MYSYISLGSNIGERYQFIYDALKQIANSSQIELLRSSPLYETEPVGIPKESPWFLNGAAEIDTDLSAQELLRNLLAIEKNLGRKRSQSKEYESRIIDLDLLLYGNEIIDQPGLQVPHPRMLERWFVLKPLSDLCPQKKIPGKNFTVIEALDSLESIEQGIKGRRINE